MTPSERRRAFYSRKPSTVIRYHTVELYHSQIGTLRFVGDFEVDGDIAYPGNGHTFTLEATAPRNAGEAVEFAPTYMDFTPPEQTSDPVTSIDIQLGRVGTRVKAELKKIRDGGFLESMSVIYRMFLSDDTSAPAEVYTLWASSVTLQATSAAITATDSNPANKNVSRIYRFTDFPGLDAT